jgi:hypothetical protein
MNRGRLQSLALLVKSFTSILRSTEMVMRFLVSATLASAMVLAFVASVFADGRSVPRDGAFPSGTHGSDGACPMIGEPLLSKTQPAAKSECIDAIPDSYDDIVFRHELTALYGGGDLQVEALPKRRMAIFD